MPTFFLRSGMVRTDAERTDSLDSGIAALAEQVAAALGMEVVLTEVKRAGNRSIIRIFIDQPGGVTLDDCERFSRRLSVLLDVEDWIPFSYILEVSSPGLDRPLVKEEDYKRFAGRSARIRMKHPIQGQRNFKGTILAVENGRVSLELHAGKRMELSVSDIEKANLVAEI